MDVNNLKLSKKCMLCWLNVAIISVLTLAWAATASATTSVYAEGAYDESVLQVYVYADITADAPLVSQCVKVTYDPAKLQVANAEKNDDIWYFGTESNKYDYKNPEDDGSAVVILGGKLDIDHPTEGVSGNRVLLGTITFNRIPESGTPDDATAPENFFGITLDIGKGGNFSNFVDTAGNVQDGPGLFTGITIREYGDANADGTINVQDMSSTRYFMVNGGIPYPWIDCNKDGNINVQDMSCVRYKMTH